jgi:glycosyltransferase involved in cell wall biosynthesis
MKISAIVAAYNEEKNIRAMLLSLVRQRLGPEDSLVEVVAVASGCTDGTHDEVQAAAREDGRIRLLVQDARLGKASAINAYLRERDLSADIIVLSSSDILLQPGCLQLMVDALKQDPKVGMTGPRPVPTNPRETLLGHMVGTLWDLHHDLAMESPKLGEITMMRASLVTPIPETTAVDEASFEAQIIQQGYTLKYVPGAVVANRGPTRVSEYLKQRRRIAAGHFWLKDTSGYAVSSMDTRRVGRLAMRRLSFSDPMADVACVAAVAVEAVARGLGYLDFKRNYSHAVWEVASTARQVVHEGEPEPAAAPASPPVQSEGAKATEAEGGAKGGEASHG